MKQIIENLKNWQAKKRDKSFVINLLESVDYFKINYPILDDNSESYHLYAGLERRKESYVFILYMIAKNKDTPESFRRYGEEMTLFIKRFEMVNIILGQDTEITGEEAQKRKTRWRSEIRKWVEGNVVFDVFDLPKQDFDFTNTSIQMEGHFGIKDKEQEVGAGIETTICPDIIIYQTNSESGAQAFFDMAKLSPPYLNSAYQKEFFLLNYKIEQDL